MKLTKGTARKAFRRFNQRYWGGTLAEPVIRLVPAGQAGQHLDSRHDWAAATWIRAGRWELEIREISREIDLRWFYGILLHEMIHMRIGWRRDHRSAPWRAEVQRLSRLGALKEVI